MTSRPVARRCAGAFSRSWAGREYTRPSVCATTPDGPSVLKPISRVKPPSLYAGATIVVLRVHYACVKSKRVNKNASFSLGNV